MESSSHRAWHEAHKRSVGCPSVSLPDHSLYSCLLLFSLCAPASTCTVKEAGSLFFFFLGWMEKQLERYAVMERAGEAMSVSLSTSLQASFMPLSLAQWLTLSTPLSLLTLLHTEPQQYIDMPLRQLITSSGCGNGVHTRVENAYRCSLSLFFFFLTSFTSISSLAQT